jgi:hypothetical protein
LQAQLDSYNTALGKYTRSNLQPVPTALDQDTLLRERQRLSALPELQMQKKESYRVPALRKTATVPDAYIVVFRKEKVFASPFSRELFERGETALSDQLRFRLDKLGIIQVLTEGDGLNVDRALRALDQAIRSKVVVATDTKLYLYAYPDSVQTLQSYRTQAMKRVPQAIWRGITEDSTPSLVFTDGSGSNLNLGF